jgi:phytoene/squalene synthetase
LFEFAPPTNPTLAASMTHEASIQTYYTIRYLADPPLREAAFRAYAYFRWVDDVIDQEQIGKAERLAFLARQQDIISRCYQGERPTNLRPKEQLVAELIHNDPEPQSGLRTYINEMMTVMAFDAERKGRLISEAELAEYTRALTTAVSEAMHYFIGHGQASPQDESRYFAVTGAHITHLLRDAIEDTAAGYYNIPQEFLEAHQFDPADVTHNAYQSWVQKRVQLARRYFAAGRAAMAQVENRRCRLAGYAYIGRFELILNAIERDNYHLRPAYPERKSKKNVLKIILAALAQTIVGSGQWRVN